MVESKRGEEISTAHSHPPMVEGWINEAKTLPRSSLTDHIFIREYENGEKLIMTMEN
jgi:hypothetical protein